MNFVKIINRIAGLKKALSGYFRVLRAVANDKAFEMVRIVFIFLSIQTCLISPAQVFVELGPVQNNRDAFSSVTVYGSNGLRQSVAYSDIEGSVFWKENWSKAFFYDSRDTFLGIYKGRFNFVTNEVHYLDRNGLERAVIPGMLNRIVFMRDDDSTAVAAVFRANIPEITKRATCKNCYVQELNQEDVKLLKITRKILQKKESVSGTMKKYYLSDQAEYFLQLNEKYEKLRKLSKDNLFSFLPNTSSFSGWIREQGLQFRKEDEFVRFIKYYNSMRQNNLP